MTHILVVRACAIGDWVLSLPALCALAELHGGSRFSLVGYPSRLDLTREFMTVEATHSIDSAPWSHLFFESVEGLRFDSAIVWMKDAAFAENLCRSGVANVLRADSFPGFGHAATHLLRTLGLPVPVLPDLWRPDTDDIIIHAGSGSLKKNWPYFDELIERLGDRALCLREAAPRSAGERYERKRIIENLSLREVVAHLRRCRAYVGNDSGITHLAAYIGCPTVALFGPTDPRVWGPIGRRTRILWKTKLEDISVDEVLLALPWKNQIYLQT